MSIQAFNWALSVKVGNGDTKLVLLSMANHAHADGRNAWASKATYADDAECSVRSVPRHITRLLELGAVRLGDQQQVAHLRADRRPVVYDLAMTDQQQADWATEHAAGGPTATPEPGANLSPRENAHEMTQPCHPATAHGVTDGVTNQAPRGDKAVSPKSYEPKNQPPQPPPSGGARCNRHPAGDGVNCRRCGTTNRLADKRAATAAAERRRAEHQAAIAADRQLRATSTPAPVVAAAVSGLRQTLHDTKAGAQ